MCYSLYLSTDCDRDMKVLNSNHVQFIKLETYVENENTHLLNLKNKWFVGSVTECSCTFRHLYSTELGFAEPQDWYPEEADEIEATRQFYKLILYLLEDEFSVECLDVWTGAKPNDISILEVDMDKVSEQEFRFFENYLFRFIKT